jgi:hypothetical protein
VFNELNDRGGSSEGVALQIHGDGVSVSGLASNGQT